MKFALVPYVQQTANSHMNGAGFFSILIVITSITLFSISAYNFYKRRNTIKSYILLGVGVNLILWIPVLKTIGCLPCAMGG